MAQMHWIGEAPPRRSSASASSRDCPLDSSNRNWSVGFNPRLGTIIGWRSRQLAARLSEVMRTLSAAVGRPSFEEATSRFRAFLSENGWPTEIAWVKSAELLEQLQPNQAKREYEFALHQGLGVCLYAIRAIGDSTFAVVE